MRTGPLGDVTRGLGARGHVTEEPGPVGEVARALHLLGGRATTGDLMMATGRPLAEVESALDDLMTRGEAEVSVTESAVLVFRRAEEPLGEPGSEERGRRRWALPFHPRRAGGPCPFDRKTLRLIRARGGVISIAELVEHTGFTVEVARLEADRLTRLYGGEAHVSWDGHVVYAFPKLVESAHGDFHVREPRPAWIRTEDPVPAPPTVQARRQPVVAIGVAAAGALAWFATFPPPVGGRALLLAAVAGASAGAAFVIAHGLARLVFRHPRLRVHRWETLRRFVLGHIFETALRGKGVVSVDGAMTYLKARTGRRRLSRAKVERALRSLAVEFGAPETRIGKDTFFGFRNVKRQFLASHVRRVRLKLRRQASGSTVFDSGDAALAAAERELAMFDRELGGEPGGSGETDPLQQQDPPR